MSDKSTQGPEGRLTSVEASDDDELIAIEAVKNVLVNEREGLPRGYRMRADKHYVDQLAAPADGQPVRMVPVGQIDSQGIDRQTDLRLLIESIRAHGIVHPLLIRRRDARYSVVAGRKRLAVAHMLRLATVPCILHEADDAQAAALEHADNVHVGSVAPDPAETSNALAAHRLVAEHLTTVRTCADLSARGQAMSRPMLDLVRAHAWRAARLVDALDLIAGAPFVPERDRSLSSIVDEVIDGFGPECRLNGINLRAQIREDLSSGGLNGRELMAGLSAALLATLPLAEHAVNPSVVIRASNSGSGALSLEVVPSDASVSERTAQRFFDDQSAADRPGGHAAGAGALAAKALAERHGGSATFETGREGSRLIIVLSRRS